MVDKGPNAELPGYGNMNDMVPNAVLLSNGDMFDERSEQRTAERRGYGSKRERNAIRSLGALRALRAFIRPEALGVRVDVHPIAADETGRRDAKVVREPERKAGRG